MLPYLQLLRLPTVFTAMADIVLGRMLVNGRTLEPYPTFFTVLAASCALYLSGMVFNDVFDVAQDTAERPNRPIPSGKVSRRSATILGCVLMLTGVGIAATLSLPTFMVAIALAVMILGYDGYLKRTPLGPIAMGSCRFLNVLLAGAPSVSDLSQLVVPPQIVVAAGLGVYIVGVTWFARTEAKASHRGQLGNALIVVNLGWMVLLGLMLAWPNQGEIQRTMFLLAVVVVSLNMRAGNAIRVATPVAVQYMIKLFLLNYVMLCAVMVFWHTGNGVAAMATAALVIPPLIISRVIAMT
jgi:4-hydroxybenzoate polyprenyltransferase